MCTFCHISTLQRTTILRASVGIRLDSPCPPPLPSQFSVKGWALPGHQRLQHTHESLTNAASPWQLNNIKIYLKPWTTQIQLKPNQIKTKHTDIRTEYNLSGYKLVIVKYAIMIMKYAISSGMGGPQASRLMYHQPQRRPTT